MIDEADRDGDGEVNEEVGPDGGWVNCGRERWWWGCGGGAEHGVGC